MGILMIPIIKINASLALEVGAGQMKSGPYINSTFTIGNKWEFFINFTGLAV